MSQKLARTAAGLLLAAGTLAACSEWRDPAEPQDATPPAFALMSSHTVSCGNIQDLRNALDAGYSEVLLPRGCTWDFRVQGYTRLNIAASSGQTLAAESGSGSRPVLLLPNYIDTPCCTGAIKLSSDGTLRELDIRGPYYNTTGHARVETAHGVNTSASTGWQILQTSINGFSDNGIHGSGSIEGVVHESQVGYNAASGITFFFNAVTGLCASHNTVSHSNVSFNGQDGIDTCASHDVYERNEFTNNGWANSGGDEHGILVAVSHGVSEGTIIRQNYFGDNIRSGVHLLTDSVGTIKDLTIERNFAEGNQHYGYQFSGSLSGILLSNNWAGENGLGFWNSHAGVTYLDNQMGNPIVGPGATYEPATCTFVTVVQGGTPPYQYQWRIEWSSLPEYNLGTAASQDVWVDEFSPESFVISVQVTDALNFTLNGVHHFINYIDLCPYCGPPC